ncbi:LysR family transcriptional regulator [Agaribacterium haliotis]|uniref:LysR family transcriptional regulator n=1 Tax=Agaribacterium haliotis TaxID=2013869 RepID=UPI000BB59E3E|nr:LysR family transcriptional regulator [Agaribacterium haliotis]
MKYTLRQLEIFLAVARHQSISLAAKDLNMSQSAASTALQEFEKRYELQLFERSAKRVRLNQQGSKLRAKAERLLNEAQDFENELLNYEQQEQLRVGASLTIGNYLAFNYLARFNQLYPEVKVDIRVGSSPEIISKVLNFEVDIGLIEAEVHHKDLTLSPWRPDNMLVFCAADHPMAHCTELTDKDLLKAEWILREPGSAHRQTFDKSMSDLLAKLNIRAELTHNEAIKNAVKAGLGLGCLSEIAVADEIKLGSLKALPLKKRPMRRHFNIVKQRHSATSKAAERWLELCLNKVG